MKRVREAEEEGNVSFVFCDVPCVHAGHLRRVTFMELRNQCLDLHSERVQLSKDLNETMRCLGHKSYNTEYARQLLTHDLVLESLSDTSTSGLDKATLNEKLALLCEDELVAAAKNTWKRIRVELLHRFNARLDALQTKLMQLASGDAWSSTIVGFKRHLYTSQSECECFLCLDPSASLMNKDEDADACYLCAEAVPQSSSGSWLESRMCPTCCTRAKTHGLCAFCWGHIDAGAEPACAGRGDLHCERASVHALNESSTLDTVFGR